ncbi:MAG: tetratricopeptide repeat protein, partial [Alphaproteobacteria bacterium]|nr:tetratricopeptide repeat protein [Alphaproteobacteria bacterium]
LAFYKKNYPEGRIESAHVLVHLGVLYKEMKNYNQAKDILKKSLIIYERHYGKNHIETAQVLKKLGQVYLLENNMEAAENHFRKALDILTKHNHPKAYIALEGISESYLRKFVYAKNQEKPQQQTIKNQIMENLTQALKIMSDHFPKDSPHMTRIQSKINSISENPI